MAAIVKESSQLPYIALSQNLTKASLGIHIVASNTVMNVLVPKVLQPALLVSGAFPYIGVELGRPGGTWLLLNINFCNKKSLGFS